jgi:hypothetical protein
LGGRAIGLALIMLATIGAWEICKSAGLAGTSVASAQGAPADHFRCYSARTIQGDSVAGRIVTTTNQFGVERMQIVGPEFFCLPTVKNTDEAPCGHTSRSQCGGACADLSEVCTLVTNSRGREFCVCKKST